MVKKHTPETPGFRADGELLRTDQLNVGYDGEAVIRNVQIEALKGQTICLIGPNGAGKSTILRTLSGMLAPVDGTVYIDGTNIRQVKSSALSRLMAVVLTEKLNLNLTMAYDIVAMGRMPYTGFFGKLEEHDHEIVRSCMATVGAENLADKDYNNLSDGEKQKVLIARALAQEPELIILDEPTSHLDIKHKIEVVRILNQLSAQRGMTVILALHDVDLAVKNCQIVLLVKDGRILAQGRPEDVIQEQTIGELYDVEGASYNSLLGLMELKNLQTPVAFVAAGGGKGIPVYRYLGRAGIGVSTGILFDNDIDYAVAKAMDLTVVAQKGFCPIEPAQITMAEQLLSSCSFAVDSGFPVGPYNAVNLRLLKTAAQKGTQVYSFRQDAEIEEIYEALPIRPVHSVGELQTATAGKQLSPGSSNGIIG